LLPIWLSLPLIVALFAGVVYGTWTLWRKQVAFKWAITLTCLRLAIFAVFSLILCSRRCRMRAARRSCRIARFSRYVEEYEPRRRQTAHGSKRRRRSCGRGIGRRSHRSVRLHWFNFDRTRCRSTAPTWTN